MDAQSGPNDNPSAQEPTRVVNGFEKRVIGDSVLIRQGAAQSIEANQITIRQGGVGVVRSGNAELNSCGAVLSQADSIVLRNSSAVGVYSKGPSSFDQSTVQLMASTGSVSMDQSAGLVMAAREISLENSAVVFLVAKTVNGNVTPMFGPKEAAVFGAVAGLVGSVVLIISKLVSQKKK